MTRTDRAEEAGAAAEQAAESGASSSSSRLAAFPPSASSPHTLHSVSLAFARIIDAATAKQPNIDYEALSVPIHAQSAVGLSLLADRFAFRSLHSVPHSLMQDACMLTAAACEDHVLWRLLHLCVLNLPIESAGSVALLLLGAMRRCQRFLALRTASTALTPALFTQISMILPERRTVGVQLLKNLVLGYQLGPQLWHDSLPAFESLLQQQQRDLALGNPEHHDTVARDLEEIRVMMYTCAMQFGGYSYTRDTALSILEAAPMLTEAEALKATANIPPAVRPSKAMMDALLHIYKWALETHPPSLGASRTLALTTQPTPPANSSEPPLFPMPGVSTSWFEGMWLCSAAGGSIDWALKYQLTGRRMQGMFQKLARAGSWTPSGVKPAYPRFLPDALSRQASSAASAAVLLHSVLSPTVMCPRHTPALYKDAPVFVRWDRGEYYMAKVSNRRFSSFAITSDHFGTRWLEAKEFQMYAPLAVGSVAQTNLAKSPELATVPSHLLIGRRVLALRNVHHGLSGLSGSSLANLSGAGSKIDVAKAYLRGVVIEPAQVPTGPIPQQTILIKFDHDSKLMPIKRELVYLFVPITAHNMSKVDNWVNHARTKGAAREIVNAQEEEEANSAADSLRAVDEAAASSVASFNSDEDSSDHSSDDEGDSVAPTHPNIVTSLNSAPSTNTRDSAAPYQFGSLQGILHHDLDHKLTFTGHWSKVDQEHTGAVTLRFHKPECTTLVPAGISTVSPGSPSSPKAGSPLLSQSPASIVMPDSFSGPFYHSEHEYGQWVGVRNQYREKFKFAQPSSKQQAMRRTKLQKERAATSSTMAAAPAPLPSLFRRASSSLLYFDGFHTSVRIPGDYALSFPGFSPYSIELMVFIPPRDNIRAETEDAFGNSSSSSGYSASNVTHVNRQVLFSKANPSSTSRTVNYSLELNTMDNTLIWSHGFHTFYSTSSLLHHYRAAAGNASTPPPTALQPGRWCHIACCYDGRFVRLYLDGHSCINQEVHTTMGLNSDGNGVHTPLVLGGAWGPFGHSITGHFHGMMSEVRVWNYARTQNEISAGMNRPMVGHEAGLLGYWPLHCVLGGMALDKSGMGLHGTVINIEEKAGEKFVRSPQEMHNAHEIHRMLWNDEAERQAAQLKVAALPWIAAPPSALCHLRSQSHTNVNDEFLLCGQSFMLSDVPLPASSAGSEASVPRGIAVLASAPAGRSPLSSSLGSRPSHSGGVWSRCKLSVEQGFDCNVELVTRLIPTAADPEPRELPFVCALQLYSGSLMELAPMSGLLLNGTQMSHSLTIHVRVGPVLRTLASAAAEDVAAPTIGLHVVELNILCGNQFGEACRIAHSSHSLQAPIPERVEAADGALLPVHTSYQFRFKYDASSQCVLVSVNGAMLTRIQLNLMQDGLGLGQGPLSFQAQSQEAAINKRRAGLHASPPSGPPRHVDVESENERKVFAGILAGFEGVDPALCAASASAVAATHTLSLGHWSWNGPSILSAANAPQPSPLCGHSTQPSHVATSALERVLLLGALNALLEVERALRSASQTSIWRLGRPAWLQACQMLQSSLASAADCAPALCNAAGTLRKRQTKQLRSLIIAFEKSVLNPDAKSAAASAVAASSSSSNSSVSNLQPPLLSEKRQAAVNAAAANAASASSSAAPVDLRESWLSHFSQSCHTVGDVLDGLQTLFGLLADNLFLTYWKPPLSARDAKPEYSTHDGTSSIGNTKNFYGLDTITRMKNYLSVLKQMEQPLAHARSMRYLLKQTIEERAKPTATLRSPFESYESVANAPPKHAHSSSLFDDTGPNILQQMLADLSLRPSSVRANLALRQLWQACSMAMRLHGQSRSKCLQSLLAGQPLLHANVIGWDDLMAKVRSEAYEIVTAELQGQMTREDDVEPRAALDPALMPMLRARSVFVASQLRSYHPLTGRLRSVDELPEDAWSWPADSENASTVSAADSDDDDADWSVVSADGAGFVDPTQLDPSLDVSSASWDTSHGTVYFHDLDRFVGYFAVGNYWSVAGKLAGFLHNQTAVAAQQIARQAEGASPLSSTVSPPKDSYEFAFGTWHQNNYRFYYPCHFLFNDNLSKLLGHWSMSDMDGTWLGNKHTSGGGGYAAVSSVDRANLSIVPGSAMTHSLNLHQRSYFGYSALLNLGNSCYQNSSLICLFFTSEFRAAVLALSLHLHPRAEAKVSRPARRRRQEWDLDQKKKRDAALSKMGSGPGDDDDASAFAEETIGLDDALYRSDPFEVHGSGANSAQSAADAARAELKLISALQLVFASLQWSARSYLDLSYFVNAAKKPYFNMKLQQDSLQFVQYLLETLANPVLLAAAKDNTASMDQIDALTLQGGAAPASSSSSSPVPSLSSSLFGGSICTSYVCSTCGHRRENVEQFLDLGVSFPKNWEAITDIAIITSSKLSNIAPPQGYQRIGINITMGIKGAGYSYLCVRRAAGERPITDLLLVHGPTESDCAARTPAGFVRLPANLNEYSAVREYSHLYLCLKRDINGSPITQLDLITWFESDGRSVAVPDGFATVGGIAAGSKQPFNLHTGVDHKQGAAAAALAVAAPAVSAPPSIVLASSVPSLLPLPPPPPPSTRALYLCYKKGSPLRDVVVVFAPSLPEAHARTPAGYSLIEVDFNLEHNASEPHWEEGTSSSSGGEQAGDTGCYIAYTSGGDELPITGLSVRPLTDASIRLTSSSPLERISYYSLGCSHYALVVVRGDGCPLFAPEVFRAPAAPRKYGGFETLNLHPNAAAEELRTVQLATESGVLPTLWHRKGWKSADGESLSLDPPLAVSVDDPTLVAVASKGLPVPDASGEFDCWVVEGSIPQDGSIRGIVYFDPAWMPPLSHVIVPQSAPTLNPLSRPPAPQGRWVMDGVWHQKASKLPQSLQFVFDDTFTKFVGCWQNGESEGPWTGSKMAASLANEFGDCEMPSDSVSSTDSDDDSKRRTTGSRISRPRPMARRSKSRQTAQRDAPVGSFLEAGPIVHIGGVLSSQLPQLMLQPAHARRTVLQYTGDLRFSANLHPSSHADSLWLAFERAVLPADPSADYAGPHPIVDVQVIWPDIEPVPDGFEVAQMMSTEPATDATAVVDAATTHSATPLNTNADTQGTRIFICVKRASSVAEWSSIPLLYDVMLLRESERAPPLYTKIAATPCGLEGDLNASCPEKPVVVQLATRLNAYVRTKSDAKQDSAAKDTADNNDATPIAAAAAAEHTRGSQAAESIPSAVSGDVCAPASSAASSVAAPSPLPPTSPLDAHSGLEGTWDTSSGSWHPKVLYATRGRRVRGQLHAVDADSSNVMRAGGRFEGVMFKKTPSVPVKPSSSSASASAAAAAAAVPAALVPRSSHLFGRFVPLLTTSLSSCVDPRLLSCLRHRNKFASSLEFDIDAEQAKINGKLTWWHVTLQPLPPGATFVPGKNEHLVAEMRLINWSFVRDTYAQLSFLRNPRALYSGGSLSFSDATRSLTLQSMLHSYFGMEIMPGVKCSSAQCAGRPTNTHRMAALQGTPPKFLLLTTKRFAYDYQLHSSSKIITQLESMEHVIRMPTLAQADNDPSSSPRVESGSDPLSRAKIGEVEYGLYGMIVHAGSKLDGGHYLNYCRSSDENLRYADRTMGMQAPLDSAADGASDSTRQSQWLCFNDHTITHTSWTLIQHKFAESLFDTPYMFFYRQLEPFGRDPVVPERSFGSASAAPAVSLDPSITVVTSATSRCTPSPLATADTIASVPLVVSSSSLSLRAPSVLSSPSVVCPGLADAISADNALFFQEEIACAVGQTNQQRVKRPESSSSSIGREAALPKDAGSPSSVVSASSSVCDLPSTPAAFFLHKIQSEIRRKHEFSLAWGDSAGSTKHTPATNSGASTSSIESASGASSVSVSPGVCCVCHSSAHSSCVCPYSRRSLAECAECFAPMSAAQLSDHMQLASSLLSQYQSAAVASKIALPAEWRSAQPDQRVCPHAFMQKHFAQYAWPYAAESAARGADAITAASRPLAVNGAAGSPSPSSVSADLAIFGGPAAPADAAAAAAAATPAAVTDPSGIQGALARVSDAFPWPASHPPLPDAVPLTRTGSVHRAASSHVDQLSSIIEQQHGITLSDDHSDTEADADAPGSSGQRGSSSPRVAPVVSAPGEEFPPNCEACHEEMHSFTQFLNHMQVCPAM